MADPAYIVDGVLTDGEAWVALNSKTLTSAATSITFTSGYNDADEDVGGVQAWDQYMDLFAISYWRSSFTNGSSTNFEIGWYNLNGDTTAANYISQSMYVQASTVTSALSTSSFSNSIAYGVSRNPTANVFCCCISRFFDINSGKWKSSYHEGANDEDGYGWLTLSTNVWKSQAPITSILLRQENGTMPTGTRIDLFGILPRMVA